MLTSLAGAQAATGRFEEAHAALLESMELIEPQDGELLVKLTAACAGMEQLLGRHEAAHARLEHALEGLADPASPQAVALMISLAHESFYRLRAYSDRGSQSVARQVMRPQARWSMAR